MKPSGLVLLIAVLALVSLGCTGGADHPPLGDVTGTVTFDGKPLVKAMVLFTPQGGQATRSVGGTGENGKYELNYGVGNVMGAVLGTHSVSITQSPADPTIPHANIPARYNSQSQLTATVKEGENTFNFDLTSQP